MGGGSWGTAPYRRLDKGRRSLDRGTGEGNRKNILCSWMAQGKAGMLERLKLPKCEVGLP